MISRQFILAILAVLVWTVSPVLAQRTGITITTFAALPATCVSGQPFVVIDSNGACTAGSGSRRWCICDGAGTAYVPDPGGTPGTDSVGTVALDDGADTPLAGEWVQVDAGDTTQFSYRTDAELLTDTGAAALASPTFTGDPLAPTPSVDDDDTSIATTAFVQAETLGGDASGTLGAVVIDDVQTATTNTETAGNSTTQVASTAFVDGEIRGAWGWNAFDVYVDGTKCKSPTAPQVNSGPIIGAIDCDDDNASVIYGDTLDELYEGGTIIFTVRAINENATPSGNMEFDVSMQCRGDSDVINSTWGSAQAVTMTFTTQFDEEQEDSSAITPDGTCAAGDTVYWRAVLDATATTTTQMADVLIIGFSGRES